MSPGVACGVEIKVLRRARAASSRRPPRHLHDICSMAWRLTHPPGGPGRPPRSIAVARIRQRNHLRHREMATSRVDGVLTGRWPRRSCVTFFKDAHVFVARRSEAFLAELGRHNYVTPTSYLELLATYKQVLALKRDEVGTLKTRLRVGLDKLIATAEQVRSRRPVLVSISA